MQAIVRGCGSEAPMTMSAEPKHCFGPLSAVEDGLLSFAETQTVSDELANLYKPFHAALQPVSSQAILLKEPEQQQIQTEQPATSRRSRKNQKRVVQHVSAEGHGSDLWAWRKYGQKPIKGSPYPRSYYRCSSSKGCSARKLVERSQSDPAILIVTYTSEHNHNHPVRRSSVSGSRRSKLRTPEEKGNHSPSSSKVLSPRTSLMAPIEDEFVQRASVKTEEGQTIQANEVGDDISMPEIMLGTEFFPSIEEFDELTAELALDGCFWDQLLDICPVP